MIDRVGQGPLSTIGAGVFLGVDDQLVPTPPVWLPRCDDGRTIVSSISASPGGISVSGCGDTVLKLRAVGGNLKPEGWQARDDDVAKG